MSTMSGGGGTPGAVGSGTGPNTRQLGTLSKFQQNFVDNAAAMYMTFASGDAYWIMFDGNSGQSTSTTDFHANNTGNDAADFELLDGGAYVRTEVSATRTMLIPWRWPIVRTQRVTVLCEGTEFIVQNTDAGHNVVKVHLLKGGPVVIADGLDPNNAAELATEGNFITATFNPTGNAVNYSAELKTDLTDPFIAGILNNAANLCQ